MNTNLTGIAADGKKMAITGLVKYTGGLYGAAVTRTVLHGPAALAALLRYAAISGTFSVYVDDFGGLVGGFFPTAKNPGQPISGLTDADGQVLWTAAELVATWKAHFRM